MFINKVLGIYTHVLCRELAAKEAYFSVVLPPRAMLFGHLQVKELIVATFHWQIGIHHTAFVMHLDKTLFWRPRVLVNLFQYDRALQAERTLDLRFFLFKVLRSRIDLP